MDHPYRTDSRFGSSDFGVIVLKDTDFIKRRMDLLKDDPSLVQEPFMLGVEGVSEFSRLPYFDVASSHILCFMHCMANTGTSLYLQIRHSHEFFEHLVRMLFSKEAGVGSL